MSWSHNPIWYQQNRGSEFSSYLSPLTKNYELLGSIERIGSDVSEWVCYRPKVSNISVLLRAIKWIVTWR